MIATYLASHALALAAIVSWCVVLVRIAGTRRTPHVLQSLHFDMRSLFLNYENALCFSSSAAIAAIAGFIDQLISECPDEVPVFPERRVVEQIAVLLAPEL